MEKYFKYLGIPISASVFEIKKAFRKKALKLHPDRNDSPNATEEFIKLNEYYEILINYKTSKTYSNSKKRFTKVTPKSKNWHEELRENARKRAQASTKMTVEQFLNSKTFRNGYYFDVGFDYFRIAFIVVLLIVLPAIIQITSGKGSFAFLMICFVCLPMIASEYRELKKNKEIRSKFQKNIAAYLERKNKNKA